MKLEQNCYYFWSVSKSVIFQVERLAEFHCACLSHLLLSNSSSFTYLFGESRTQKCRILFQSPPRESACSMAIMTWSLSGFLCLSRLCSPQMGQVWCLHCSDCRVKSGGRFTAQREAWQRAEAGSLMSHPRSHGTASSFLSSEV